MRKAQLKRRGGSGAPHQVGADALLLDPQGTRGDRERRLAMHISTLRLLRLRSRGVTNTWTNTQTSSETSCAARPTKVFIRFTDLRINLNP